ALAAADTERRQTERASGFAELVGEAQDDPRPAHPYWMTEADPAAAHVQLVAIELELPLAGDHLRGESLVDLDPIEVLDREAGLVQNLLRGRNRADPHDLGGHTGPRPRAHYGPRPHAPARP